MGGAQAGVFAAIGVILLTVIVRQLLPGGTRTFQLLRRHRLAREAAREIGPASDYHVRIQAGETQRQDAEIRDSGSRPSDAIDDRTWADLDLDEVFLKLERTTSQVGRQYLYRLLRTPSYDPIVLQQRDDAATRLGGDPALTARINAALGPLADDRSAQLVYLMFGDLPKRPRFAWVFLPRTHSALVCSSAPAAG